MRLIWGTVRFALLLVASLLLLTVAATARTAPGIGEVPPASEQFLQPQAGLVAVPGFKPPIPAYPGVVADAARLKNDRHEVVGRWNFDRVPSNQILCTTLCHGLVTSPGTSDNSGGKGNRFTPLDLGELEW